MAEDYDLRVISLGAGVQSSAMYLMACAGEFEHTPDVAIFADTQTEPPWVYETLEFLKSAGTIPIHIVSAGNLGEDWWRGQRRKGDRAADPDRAMPASIPFHVRNEDGSKGMLQRQCTKRYKLEPIYLEVRRLLGLKKGERVKGRFSVEMWVGISVDEVERLRQASEEWVSRRHPLVYDTPMKRGDCINWMLKRGYPMPQRSACIFCPYRSDREWADLKEAPEVWAEAVRFDERLRAEPAYANAQARARGRTLTGVSYVHASLKPLRDVVLSDSSRQMDLFSFECEGMCGV